MPIKLHIIEALTILKLWLSSGLVVCPGSELIEGEKKKKGATVRNRRPSFELKIGARTAPTTLMALCELYRLVTSGGTAWPVITGHHWSQLVRHHWSQLVTIGHRWSSTASTVLTSARGTALFEHCFGPLVCAW